MKKIFFGLVLLIIIMIPIFVSADVVCDKVGLNCTAEGNFGNADVAVFVGSVIKGVLALLGVIVLIFMVYGGYLWMMSGGNDQMVKKSKDILINAAIGLIIVLAAYAITTFVVSRIYSAANSSESLNQIQNACKNLADQAPCRLINGDMGLCSNEICIMPL